MRRGNGFADVDTQRHELRVQIGKDRPITVIVVRAGKAAGGNPQGFLSTLETLQRGVASIGLDLKRPLGINARHLHKRRVAVKIGSAHVCTPVTNAHLVCRLLLEKKKNQESYAY